MGGKEIQHELPAALNNPQIDMPAVIGGPKDLGLAIDTGVRRYALQSLHETVEPRRMILAARGIKRLLKCTLRCICDTCNSSRNIRFVHFRKEKRQGISVDM